MENVIERAKELVGNIYDQMSIIERCDSVIKSVKGNEFVFLDENSEAFHLDGILSDEQMDKVNQIVIDMIYENKSGAERFLESLTCGNYQESKNDDSDSVSAAGEIPSVEEDVHFEETIDSPSAAAKEIKHDPEDDVQRVLNDAAKPELTIEAVREAYTDGTMTLDQTAEYFGMPRSSLYKFVQRNGLKKPKKGDWRDADVESRRNASKKGM